MKSILAAILCLAIPISVFASDNSYKVIFDGGSLPSVKIGTKVKLYIEGSSVKFVNGKEGRDHDPRFLHHRDQLRLGCASQSRNRGRFSLFFLSASAR